MAEWPEVSLPRVLLVALALVMVIVVAQAANSSAAAFSVSNSGWEGSSDIRSLAAAEGADARVAVETSAYDAVAPSETVGFVLSPDSAYSSDEMLDTATFVRRGGTLVVAAEGPDPANALLAGLGASARIGETPLYDVRENFRSSAFPVADNVSDHPLVSRVGSLTLNHGTVVEPNDATVLVNTSEYAYLDETGDGRYSDNETLDNRPVATVEEVGEGRVVVVSDASVFINSMLDRRGNRRFVRALAAGKSTVLLDHSHAEGLAAVPRAVLFLRNSGPLRFAVGTLALGAVAVWVRRPGLFRRPDRLRRSDWLGGSSPSESADWPRSDGGGGSETEVRGDADREDLAASLAERYPDRDRVTVERVADRLDRSDDE